jgi:hypothetical protein
MEVCIKFKRNIFLLFLVVIICFAQVNASVSSGGKYPEASSRNLTSEDLAGKSLWELKIMRNEIFARHGYKFKSEEMKNYFNKQKWYEPKYDDVISELTGIENANIKMIKQYEDNLQESKPSPKISELIENQKREIVFKTPWGSGETELNHMIPEEANPEGPMSFVVDDSGTIFVLDQVNKRVQVFDKTGKHTKSIPLLSTTYSDIDIGKFGNLFILDQWKNGAVLLIDQEGNLLKKVELIGKGIAETGGVWKLYSRKDGLWVSYDDYLVRLCDPSGEPDEERLMIDGILCRDGKHVIKSKILGDITVTVTKSLLGKSNIDRYNVYFDIPVLFINLLDMDEDGNIYLGAELLEESGNEGPPYSIENSHEVVVVIDSNGKEKKIIYMPVSTKVEEVKRPLLVTRDGTIYQLVIEEEGATMWRYSP